MKKIKLPLIRLESLIALSEILLVCLMLSLTLSCKSGKTPITSTDLCEGAHLIYLDGSRKDKVFSTSNNEFFCGDCFNYLSNEERAICEDVE